jgi:type II secretory ATPase GspE/PulE/Tfp pilus assembly ATPase PilB-like protein
MIDIDGISFNDRISDQIVGVLRAHDPGLGEVSHDQVSARVSKATLMAAIGEINNIPFFPRIREFADPGIIKECEPRVLTRGMFVPVCRRKHELIVAVSDPWNPLAEDYLGLKFPELEVQKIVTLSAEIARLIESVTTTAGPTRSELESIEVDDIDDRIRDFDVTGRHDEPIAQLVSTVLAEAIKRHASDIHFKVEKEVFYYMYRVDGDLGFRTEIPMKLKDRVDAFLLNQMRLATEKRSTMPGISGRFSVSYLNRSIDVRYERHRTYRGYHVTMRLLDKSNIDVALGKGNLGFDSETLFELRRVMRVPSGIIVMSGPTGSGKSTTLNAMLRELNRPEDNILTLENPVEDEIPGVTHCDLKNSSEFKPMITSFMRSDPDIILMGEVRDKESAELAVEAAITGHKVLTTIHTPRASQIIERFEQLGMERWKIAQTLKAACAQRLVKMLCTACREREEGVGESDRKFFNLEEEWGRRVVFKARSGGCGECGGTGYKGRTAILEIIPITPKISDLLSRGQISPYELEVRIAKEGKLPNLRGTGLRLLAEGKTDLNALAKVIDLTYTDD